MKNIEELSKKIKLTKTEKEMFELLSIPWNPCIKNRWIILINQLYFETKIAIITVEKLSSKIRRFPAK